MTPSAQLFATELTSEFVPTLTPAAGNVVCPNQWPQYETQKRLAVIGTAPSKHDLDNHMPFAGGAENLLFGSLRRYGINRADCYIGLCSAVPLPDKVKHVYVLPEVQSGLAVLRTDLAQHRPNVVLLCGQLAVDAASPSSKKNVNDWRGSIILGDPDGICPGVKCVVCLHPYDVFKDWAQFPLFTFDLQRFAYEQASPIYTPPQRTFDLTPSPEKCCELLLSITDIATPVALDIEGGVNGMSCVSFATSPGYAFIVPLATFSDRDKKLVLQSLHRFLSSRTPKILQNQLYDNFVLSWTYRSPIRNVVWDTMLSGWEIYPELPKGLGTQVSIWTREPYYKMDRKSGSVQTLHEYCCKDSACTYEIYEQHRKHLAGRPEARRHFQFNMALLSPLHYMQHRGLAYDKTSAGLSLTEVTAEQLRLQRLIDDHIQAMWNKHGQRGPKPGSVNINSPKQLADILFNRLGYPKQHPKKGREVDTSKVTTNVDAMLELRKQFNGAEHIILEHILQWRKQDGLRETLELTTDADGRMRCGYNVVGTETGRLTCYGSPTGSGANLTTITKSLRRLYTADEDHWFFQCDLAGADGWTVAAHCALRGDPTMLEDYLAGLKPAKIIALMLLHGKAVNTWTREAIKAASKDITEDGPTGWQYFACKRVQHGTNYGLGKDKMALQILKDSYKLLGRTYVLSPAECVRIQDLYLSRYPGVKYWQAACKQAIDTTQTMPCASGHVRRFFGRSKDHATYMEAYAHEPQANTTYATNLALYRLWTDRENRTAYTTRFSDNQNISSEGLSSKRLTRDNRMGVSPFRIEPLHHVHDALCGQFRKSDVEWAVPRIRSYFDNTLEIAGRQIKIPFDGAYGPNWGQLGSKYGGGQI